MAQPGQPNAAILQLAFWEALKRCEGDERVHAMDYPYNADPLIDGRLPEVLWEHMESALAELRDAAASVKPPPRRLLTIRVQEAIALHLEGHRGVDKTMAAYVTHDATQAAVDVVLELLRDPYPFATEISGERTQ